MSCHTNPCCRLAVVPFGLAAGLLWGVSLFGLGLINTYCEWGGAFVSLMASMYVGYEATVVGSFIGFAWGFVDGLIAGVVFAWLYNVCYKCMCHCCAKYCKKEEVTSVEE